MRSTPPTEVSSAGGGSALRHTLLWGFICLWVIPPLLFSSSEYVAWGRWLAALCVLPLAKDAFRGGWRGMDGRWKLSIGAYLLAQTASFAGGWQHGDGALTLLRLGAEGLLTVTGLAIGLSLLLDRAWKPALVKIGWLVLLPALLFSLAGYFLPIERFVAMGESTIYYEPIRLTLLWPTRFLTAWMGQLGWGHSNHAALLFAVAWVVIVESLEENGRSFRYWRWLIAGALLVAIFLTGSRNGWLMLAASLPFLAFGRPIRFSGKIALLLAVSVAIGSLCLRAKREAMLAASSAPPAVADTATPAPPPPPLPPPPPEQDLHVEGLLKRGSAGRMDGYRMLWEDLRDDRWIGQGLKITGEKVHHLSHEHSTFLATLRGGGFIALAGHAIIVLISGFSALTLFRNGCRWPLVLSVAVLSGLLVDHSSVIRLTGRHEFLLHWVVVLIPLILISRRSANAFRGQI